MYFNLIIIKLKYILHCTLFDIQILFIHIVKIIHTKKQLQLERYIYSNNDVLVGLLKTMNSFYWFVTLYMSYKYNRYLIFIRDN